MISKTSELLSSLNNISPDIKKKISVTALMVTFIIIIIFAVGFYTNSMNHSLALISILLALISIFLSGLGVLTH